MKSIFSMALFAVAMFMSASTSGQEASSDTAMELPRIALVRVFVTDFERSESFYREVFGLGAPQAFGDRERVFSLGGGQDSPRLVLALTDSARPNGSFAMAVADIGKVMEQAPKLGGAIARPARALAGMPVKIGFVTDPDGAYIEVIQSTQQ